MKVIAIMRSLPLEARQQLASTLVKTLRFGVSADVRADPTWTADDDRMRALYHERMRWDYREVLAANHEERWATYITDKRELMRAVRDELMVAFPGEPLKKSRGELRLHTSVHGFELETIVYSGHSWQLLYYHHLRHGPTGVDIRDICITSVTYWQYITEATIPAAAKTVGDLCRHFISAADDILAGLIDA
jgi:hypothetical protein